MVRVIRWRQLRLSPVEKARIFPPLVGVVIMQGGGTLFGPNWVTLILGLVATFALPFWIMRDKH